MDIKFETKFIQIKKNCKIGGILGGGGGGADDDDDDFGFTRFLGSASDFVTDFLGGNSDEKKKPNEGINVDSKTSEKTKKKSEFVKKTAKNSANKLKAEDDEDAIIKTIEETIENLTADEEQSTDNTTKKAESTESNDEIQNEENNNAEKDYDDDDEEDDDVSSISEIFVLKK